MFESPNMMMIISSEKPDQLKMKGIESGDNRSADDSQETEILQNLFNFVRTTDSSLKELDKGLDLSFTPGTTTCTLTKQSVTINDGQASPEVFDSDSETPNQENFAATKTRMSRKTQKINQSPVASVRKICSTRKIQKRKGPSQNPGKYGLTRVMLHYLRILEGKKLRQKMEGQYFNFFNDEDPKYFKDKTIKRFFDKYGSRVEKVFGKETTIKAGFKFFFKNLKIEHMSKHGGEEQRSYIINNKEKFLKKAFGSKERFDNSTPQIEPAAERDFFEEGSPQVLESGPEEEVSAEKERSTNEFISQGGNVSTTSESFGTAGPDPCDCISYEDQPTSKTETDLNGTPEPETNSQDFFYPDVSETRGLSWDVQLFSF